MKTIFVTVISVFIYTLSFSQKLIVNNIEEIRSTSGGWNYCKVEVLPKEDEVRSYSRYKINEIKKAVDNKGTNLVPEDIQLGNYVPVSESLNIELLKASRGATSINVEGTVNFYQPTEANGGIVKIAGFRGKPDVNLAPKGTSYTLYYYDKPTLVKKGNVDYEKRIENIEKMPEKERAFAYEVNSLISSIDYYTDEELEHTLFFAVGGDNSAVVGFEFEDDKGVKIQPSSSSYSEIGYTYYFEEKPKATMKVILNVENAKAIKTVPFTLIGLDLP